MYINCSIGRYLKHQKPVGKGSLIHIMNIILMKNVTDPNNDKIDIDMNILKLEKFQMLKMKKN